ncbi:MAG TPA: AMP-binding protein [Candidatus Acidoferrales bacterium]|nr:AMP-binding protein [Candidatus Acidoferrales bacterium]
MSVPTQAIYRWEPSKEQIRDANLTQLLARMGVDSYPALLEAIARDIRPFNKTMVELLDLHWDRTWDELLDLSHGKPFARWFVGAQFNAAANCVDRWIARGRGEQRAIIWEGEDGTIRTLNYAELRGAVARLGGTLRALGVRKGDTIGIFMPLIPETAIAMLAIAYIGAIAVPAFSGYGPQALATRLADANAKVLLTVDGVSRRGKPVAMKTVADEALTDAPSVEHVLVFRRAKIDVPMQHGRDLDWETAVDSHDPVVTYERTSANDQMMLLYTSGSTGKPKGVVHVHAGFPLKAMIDAWLCTDLRADDRILWFTDIGWMMGPWLIFSALGLGATAVLYEGTPDYPKPDRLWNVCESHGVTHLGIAPTAIRSLMVHGAEPVRAHDLSRMRILASSGEPWNTEPWKWFAHVVGGDRLPIINYSGGTEISGGIVGCFPTMPLVPNSFHGPIPGMVADVYDTDGKPLRGEVGELVVTEPWPGMTQSFWGGSATERDDVRYLASYWERFPRTWVHGDWCIIDADGYWYIRGRSDDTINVAGKRVGPAEFESALVSDARVREAAAIAVPDDIKGDVVVCLVVVKQRGDESEALRSELMSVIERVMGKSLRPKSIAFVDDLPKTRNLKVMRRVARARYLGLDLGDLSALENAAALDAIDARR